MKKVTLEFPLIIGDVCYYLENGKPVCDKVAVASIKMNKNGGIDFRYQTEEDLINGIKTYRDADKLFATKDELSAHILRGI